ncbi:hypothetical protein [Vibrio sp. Hal054]|uniref:hypothetical protein n=1 Tax=Vibrio sp. Hal054 TaxID=3035158 RepID=UPI00301DF085
MTNLIRLRSNGAPMRFKTKAIMCIKVLPFWLAVAYFGNNEQYEWIPSFVLGILLFLALFVTVAIVTSCKTRHAVELYEEQLKQLNKATLIKYSQSSELDYVERESAINVLNKWHSGWSVSN